MFSLFGQLPSEIKREILLYCPQSLPQIVCASKSINQLIGDDIYKLFHIGPTNKEITKYLGFEPPMFYKYLYNDGNFKFFLMHYDTTLNLYKCFIENAQYTPTGPSIEYQRQLTKARLQNTEITDDRNHERIDVDGKYCYDLKTEYEIYKQRTGYINRDKQYAQSLIRKQLNEIYDQYHKCENINLCFLYYYLKYNKAVFQNLEIIATNYDSTYYTSYYSSNDSLQTDSNGTLTVPLVQCIKVHVDNLYLEMVNIVEKLPTADM